MSEKFDLKPISESACNLTGLSPSHFQALKEEINRAIASIDFSGYETSSNDEPYEGIHYKVYTTPDKDLTLSIHIETGWLFLGIETSNVLEPGNDFDNVDSWAERTVNHNAIVRQISNDLAIPFKIEAEEERTGVRYESSSVYEHDNSNPAATIQEIMKAVRLFVELIKTSENHSTLPIMTEKCKLTPIEEGSDSVAKRSTFTTEEVSQISGEISRQFQAMGATDNELDDVSLDFDVTDDDHIEVKFHVGGRRLILLNFYNESASITVEGHDVSVFVGSTSPDLTEVESYITAMHDNHMAVTATEDQLGFEYSPGYEEGGAITYDSLKYQFDKTNPTPAIDAIMEAVKILIAEHFYKKD